MSAFLLIRLITKIIYALIPAIWLIFFIIYIKSKHDKYEGILTVLSIALFMYGVFDCVSTLFSLLGIE